MKGPSPDRPADGRQCWWTAGRSEATRVAVPVPDRLPGTKREAKNVERLRAGSLRAGLLSGVKYFAELARRHAHVSRKDGCEVTMSKSDGVSNLTDG